jgi:hypothetical protein
MLLKNGLESPHLVLGEFIRAMTNCNVTEEGLPNERPLDDEFKVEMEALIRDEEVAYARLLKRFEEGKYFSNSFG